MLLDWRKSAAGRQGRVWLLLPDAGAWVVVEEWLSADQFERARRAPPFRGFDVPDRDLP